MRPFQRAYFVRVLLALVAVFAVAPSYTYAGPRPKDTVSFAKLHIPHLEKRPTIEDFEAMEPSPAVAGKMLKIDGFLQRDPKDGAPENRDLPWFYERSSLRGLPLL